MADDREARVAELQEKILRATVVIEEFETSKAWAIIREDFSKAKQLIDNNWHLVKEGDEKLRELRVTKMAINSILDTVENYKHDRELAKDELYKLENPGTVVEKDYDNE